MWQTDRQTDGRRTKWSLSGAPLCWRHKNDEYEINEWLGKDLRQNDDKIKFYTGFVSFAMFWHYLFYDLYQTWEGEERCGNAPVSAYHQTDGQKPGRKRFLRPADEFPLVCMRLRLGLLQRHLADLFCISTTTVSRILNTWMNYLLDHCNARFTLWRIGTTSLLRVLV